MSGVMGGGLGLLGVFMSINILTAAEAEISNAWVRRMVGECFAGLLLLRDQMIYCHQNMTVLCIFVALLMGYRFLKTGAFYPAGLVFLLGSLTAGLMILL